MKNITLGINKKATKDMTLKEFLSKFPPMKNPLYPEMNADFKAALTESYYKVYPDRKPAAKAVDPEVTADKK